MQRPMFLLTLGVAMLIVSIETTRAQAEMTNGNAVVRAVHGDVKFRAANQAWTTLKAGAALEAGAEIKTGPNSSADLSVNGRSLLLRLGPETLLQLFKMAISESGAEIDRETHIELRGGTIIGGANVAQGSRFEIETPHGMAGTRPGTQTKFQIDVKPQPDGANCVTFYCFKGQVICAGATSGFITKILNSGESFAPCEGDVTAIPSAFPIPDLLSQNELQTVAALADDYNAFGFQLFEAVREADAKRNVFLSPLSVALALAILQDGAQGSTRDQITRMLWLRGKTTEKIDDDNRLLLDYLSGLDTNAQLEIANSLWINQNRPVNPRFIADALDAYDAEAANLDFSGGADSVNRINSWVSQHTHGKIAGIIDSLSPSDALIILDAVYFKGLWQGPFQKDLTKDKPFTLASGQKISHPLMRRSGSFSYTETPEFQLVSLPYRGTVTAYVLLPKQPLEKFLARLTLKQWNTWTLEMPEREGTVELPRFKLENQYDLNAPLQQLGMRAAFTRQADFSGIADQLYVSSVKQKTFVEVNEEGTEAAAVTAITMRSMAVMAPREEPPPFHMIVDKPFLFVLRENLTGAILFVGAIRDPR